MQEFPSIPEPTRTQLLEIVEIIQAMEGNNLLLMDLSTHENVSNSYVLIADAMTHVQRMAIIKKILLKMKQSYGQRPYVKELNIKHQWLLVDYSVFMVHIFAPEARKFYALENLWSKYPLYSLVV